MASAESLDGDDSLRVPSIGYGHDLKRQCAGKYPPTEPTEAWVTTPYATLGAPVAGLHTRKPPSGMAALNPLKYPSRDPLESYLPADSQLDSESNALDRMVPGLSTGQKVPLASFAALPQNELRSRQPYGAGGKASLLDSLGFSWVPHMAASGLDHILPAMSELVASPCSSPVLGPHAELDGSIGLIQWDAVPANDKGTGSLFESKGGSHDSARLQGFRTGSRIDEGWDHLQVSKMSRLKHTPLKWLQVASSLITSSVTCLPKKRISNPLLGIIASKG